MHDTRSFVRNKNIHDTLTPCNIFRNKDIVSNIKKKIDIVKRVVNIYGIPSRNNDLAVRNVLLEYDYGINERILTFQLSQAELRLYHRINETTDRLKHALLLRYNDNQFIYRNVSSTNSHVINDSDRKRIHMLLKTIKNIEKLSRYINFNSEKFLDDILCKHRLNMDVVKIIYKFLV